MTHLTHSYDFIDQCIAHYITKKSFALSFSERMTGINGTCHSWGHAFQSCNNNNGNDIIRSLFTSFSLLIHLWLIKLQPSAFTLVDPTSQVVSIFLNPTPISSWRRNEVDFLPAPDFQSLCNIPFYSFSAFNWQSLFQYAARLRFNLTSSWVEHWLVFPLYLHDMPSAKIPNEQSKEYTELVGTALSLH